MDTNTLHFPQKPAQAIVAPQPLVSPQRGAGRPPQALPNLMSHLKPSTSPSPLLTPPIACFSSKPPSTAPVDINPQSRAHADLLAELGIQVRDFAYESKLPPIQPYRVRQIQPVPRPLKRKEMDVFQDNMKTESAEGSSSRKSKLKREDTEPDVTQHRLHRPHALGFLNIRDFSHDPDVPLQFQPQSQSTEYSRPDNFSQSQSPYRQESEPYVVTPTVTPNGSLRWPDGTTARSTPAFQLHTESQTNHPVLLTYSQFGMPEPEPEPELLDTTGTGLVGKLTPMSSLSSVGSDVPPGSSKPLDSWTLSTLFPSSTSSPSSPKPATPPSSRYQPHRRSIHPSSPQSPTKRGLRDRKSMYKAEYPLPRPVAYSMQSSHSKAEASLDRVAHTPRSPGNRDETMVVR